MATIYAIVIDSDGYFAKNTDGSKVRNVIVKFVDGMAIPLYYEMKIGESLVLDDVSIALGMQNGRWTGDAWEEAGERVITEEMVEALRVQKLSEANAAAEQAIYAGIEVETSDGVKRFALTEVDQINISTLLAQLQAAMKGEASTIDVTKGVPYHADGELCRFWPTEKFVMIATAATNYVFYHQTYCNHLRFYIKGLTEYGELEAVHYGMDLPQKLQESMAALLGQGG